MFPRAPLWLLTGLSSSPFSPPKKKRFPNVVCRCSTVVGSPGLATDVAWLSGGDQTRRYPDFSLIFAFIAFATGRASHAHGQRDSHSSWLQLPTIMTTSDFLSKQTKIRILPRIYKNKCRNKIQKMICFNAKAQISVKTFISWSGCRNVSGSPKRTNDQLFLWTAPKLPVISTQSVFVI